MGILLIGVGMMFLPLGDTPGGRGVLLILGWLLGGTIYVVTLSGVAMLHHLTHSPERIVQRVRERLAKLKQP